MNAAVWGAMDKYGVELDAFGTWQHTLLLQDVPRHETMSSVPQGALLALLAAILHCTMTSPVWMPQFVSGGQFIP
jgi:hypothetical protein